MARTYNRLPEREGDAHGYDLWEVIQDGKMLGWYFVPEGTTGEEYDEALGTAMTKLVALGLNETEVRALLGRQLF
jgi:hypothetical protein